MAKPILIIKFPIKLYNDMGESDYHLFLNGLTRKFNDYHIFSQIVNSDGIEFECLNDCKGLKDVDIEKLIKDFKNGKA